MKWKARIVVRLKEGLNDPEGRVIGKALKNLGYRIEELKVPKYFEVVFESDEPEKDAEEMCRRLLANPVIHTYSYEIEPLGE
ncbi:phosphoribosylformylglycinamidine synthase subunit PurS [Thermococcus sp.]